MITRGMTIGEEFGEKSQVVSLELANGSICY